MHGRITVADNVRGEHRGQAVRRTWAFLPRCGFSACSRVRLVRRRSPRHLLDSLVLRRQASGLFAGSGRFWVVLICGTHVIPRGGVARETISVRVTRTQRVGTTLFATAVRASYVNARRINRTSCPGGIGHDAATYTGRLTSPLPGPPAARFNDTVDLARSTASFSDASRPGRGGAPVVAWAWNFGDPNAPYARSTRRNPQHTYAVPGTYTVTLTVRDAYGQTATTTQQVTV